MWLGIFVWGLAAPEYSLEESIHLKLCDTLYTCREELGSLHSCEESMDPPQSAAYWLTVVDEQDETVAGKGIIQLCYLRSTLRASLEPRSLHVD